MNFQINNQVLLVKITKLHAIIYNMSWIKSITNIYYNFEIIEFLFFDINTVCA